MISRNQDRFYGLHAIVASIYSIANQFEAYLTCLLSRYSVEYWCVIVLPHLYA